jgi:ribosomal protein L11 methyltransferase
MKYRRDQRNNCLNVSSGPYRDLFIYYFQGRLKPDVEVCQDDFIGNWEEDNYSFLFFSSPANRQVETLLLRQPQLRFVDSYRMPYDQWLGESYSTFEHGNFRIMPPWQTRKESADMFEDKLEIVLDPGLVFGTGTHPTTRACLEALEVASHIFAPETVLDLGTGTGLLALAAARLGSERVIAVDLNSLAAKTAAENIRRNHLEHRILVIQGKAEDLIEYGAELVMANIHYDVMQHLIRTEGFFSKKKFILSGLLRSEAKKIAAELARHPVRILKQWTHNAIWHTFYGEKY